MKINVHSYESLGTFDGPGLRLVVFLQGCNFRCLYCANPDTIDLKGESKATDLQHIVDMAVSEKPFFGKRGGVTFSGGEPTVQAEALIPLVKRLKEQGIHVCIDTNGSIWNEHVEECVSSFCWILVYCYSTNIVRNIRSVLQNDTPAYKAMDLLYNALTLAFVKGLPFVAEIIKQRKEERNADK